MVIKNVKIEYFEAINVLAKCFFAHPSTEDELLIVLHLTILMAFVLLILLLLFYVVII